MGKIRTGRLDWPSLPARRSVSSLSRSRLRGSSLRPSVRRTTALILAASYDVPQVLERRPGHRVERRPLGGDQAADLGRDLLPLGPDGTEGHQVEVVGGLGGADLGGEDAQGDVVVVLELGEGGRPPPVWPGRAWSGPGRPRRRRGRPSSRRRRSPASPGRCAAAGPTGRGSGPAPPAPARPRMFWGWSGSSPLDRSMGLTTGTAGFPGRKPNCTTRCWFAGVCT